MTIDNKTEIYNEYYQKVRNYILSKINNFHEAEDLCSNVFVKVYKNIDKYDSSKSSISTWIFTITRNTLIDYYRAKKIHVELDENIAIKDDDDTILTDENLEIMADALENLDDRLREIILLHYYKNESLRDIANKMGISYAYIKILHQKALIKLRKYFD